MKTDNVVLFPNNLTSQLTLATVIEAIAGKAKHLNIENRNYSVYSQASHVPALQLGDEVFCTQTVKGIVVLAKLLEEGTLPLPNWTHSEPGCVHLNWGSCQVNLNSNGHIKFNNAKASFELTPEGRVVSQSTSLTQLCRDDIHVETQKGKIRFYCPE